MQNDNQAQVIDQACGLIASYMGETSAEMYRKYYMDKGVDIITVSIRELLSELVGEKKANEELNRVFESKIMESGGE